MAYFSNFVGINAIKDGASKTVSKYIGIWGVRPHLVHRFHTNIFVVVSEVTYRGIHCSSASHQVQKMTRLRVVDNSEIGKAAMLEGRAAKVIHVYSKAKFGVTGDKVLVTIKGEMKKAILVGCHQEQKAFIPRFDSNNAVLVDENGSPLGTRILAPIPTFLRKKLTEMSRPKGADYTKLLSIATRFV